MGFILIGPGVRDEIYLDSLFRHPIVTQTIPSQRVQAVGEQEAAENFRRRPRPKSAQPIAIDNALVDELVRSDTIPVTQVMTRVVRVVTESASIDEIWRLIVNHSIRHLPVIDENRVIVGIISDRDMLSAQADQSSSNSSVKRHSAKSIMHSPVICTSSETTLDEAARVIVKLRIGCLPVTNAEGKIQGIITRDDLLRAVLNIEKLTLWL